VSRGNAIEIADFDLRIGAATFRESDRSRVIRSAHVAK
jgi:hypothetical protein